MKSTYPAQMSLPVGRVVFGAPAAGFLIPITHSPPPRPGQSPKRHEGKTKTKRKPRTKR